VGYSALLSLLLWAFTGYHLSLVVSGLTTKEHLKGRHNPLARAPHRPTPPAAHRAARRAARPPAMHPPFFRAAGEGLLRAPHGLLGVRRRALGARASPPRLAAGPLQRVVRALTGPCIPLR